MNNNKFVIEKQGVIEKACNIVTKHSDSSKDLAQEVSMYFLTNDLPDEMDKIDGFIFVVAYKMFHLSGSSFKRMQFDVVLQRSVDIDELNESEIPCESESSYSEYKEYVKDLTEIEQVWISEVLKRNMSINLFCEHSGIHRATATERMESIYSKIRKQNK